MERKCNFTQVIHRFYPMRKKYGTGLELIGFGASKPIRIKRKGN